MKVPQLNFLIQGRIPRIFLLVAYLGIMAFSISAQRRTTKIEAVNIADPTSNIVAAGDVDQCSQLTNAACDWQNGNLNENNSSYVEGQSVVYRTVLGGVAPNSTNNMVSIGYDTTEGGVHTLDYLTSFNRSIVGANPCTGASGCNFPGTLNTDYTEFPIPADMLIPGVCPTCVQGGSFRLYNGTITGVGSIVNTGTFPGGTSQASILVTFTAAASGTPVLTWGGHIATRFDWGINNAAAALSGSPYHMRRADGGNGDRSLKVSAVTFPARITIIKSVITAAQAPNGPGTTASFAFPFTGSINFGRSPMVPSTAFSLTDNYDQINNTTVPVQMPMVPRTDSILNSADILTFSPNNTTPVVTVSENSIVGNAPGFYLDSISCVSAVQGGLPSANNNIITVNPAGAGGSVGIVLEEGEFVTCTFNNSNVSLNPSAATASVNGRVVDAAGRGISGARISVADLGNGGTYTVVTNPFGYYTVPDLQVGEFYLLTVAHKRYVFSDNSRSFTLNDNLAGINFTANP